MNIYGLCLDNQKVVDEKSRYRYYCKCGHSAIIYPFEKRKKKLCDWCGNYIYANKREEFKDKLRKVGVK